MNKIKIAITGASGFIGKHLIEDLDANFSDVILITRNKEKITQNSKNFKIIEADLLNVDSLKLAFKNVDLVINLAAEVRDYHKIKQTNIQGTKNLIEAIEFCHVKKIIHLSSVGVLGQSYSNRKLILNEDEVCDPKNEYEKTKRISENIILEASKNENFELVILRPTNVFGEHHPFNAILNLMKHIQQKKIIVLDKKATVNYLYVKDLSAIICELISISPPFKIINVGSSDSLHDFLKMMAKELDSKLNLIFIPTFVVKLLNVMKINKLNSVTNKIVHDDLKLKSFFNYSFKNSIGIKNTIQFYEKNKLIS